MSNTQSKPEIHGLPSPSWDCIVLNSGCFQIYRDMRSRPNTYMDRVCSYTWQTVDGEEFVNAWVFWTGRRWWFEGNTQDRMIRYYEASTRREALEAMATFLREERCAT